MCNAVVETSISSACRSSEVMEMRAGTAVGLIGLVALFAAAACVAQAQSSASAFASSGEPIRSVVGTFVFERGESIGLELKRQEPCPCLCDPFWVTAMRVVDGQDNAIFVAEQQGPTGLPAPYEAWIGRWDLVDQLGAPVPEGVYGVVVETTIGEFRACMEVVAAGTAERMGRVSSEASVCGISLAVYRLVDEAVHDRTVVLREGERLMVALEGNPTTGFEWEIESEPAAGLLQRIEGLAYGSPATLIGAGGTFFFRYAAVGVGQGGMTFVYRRSWETVPPEKTVSAVVVVR